MVVLFWTKCAVRSHIKPGIHKLTIARGQSNFSIAFIFVSFEGKGYYLVASVGQLSFDCRSYCGCSRRICKGNTKREVEKLAFAIVADKNILANRDVDPSQVGEYEGSSPPISCFKFCYEEHLCYDFLSNSLLIKCNRNWTNRIEFRKSEQKISEQNGI